MKNLKKNVDRILAIALSLMMIFSGLTLSTSNVSAEETPSNFFTTSDNGDGTVTITKYSDSGPKDVVIPTTIDGKKVTKIGENAFCNYSLSSGNPVYKGIELKSVEIPEGVTAIGNHAFHDNPIKTLKLPSTLEKIGNGAFYGSGLTSLELPFGLTDIGGSAFIGNECTEIVIPNTVTTIGLAAFQSSRYLKKVTIPGSTKIIGDYAFEDCHNLKDLELSEGLETIGVRSFAESELSKLVIPSTVTTIGSKAFENSTEGSKTLDKLVILGKQTTIGTNSFNLVTTDTFKMYGYVGSPAQTYATDKAYDFIALDTWLTVDAIADQVETGSAVEPTVVVKDGATTLTKDKDYTVSYKNNTEPGTATVTVTGKGDYEYAIATKDFTIKAKQVTGITVKSNPKKVSYELDEDLDLTGGKITVSYDNGTSEDIAMTSNMVSGYDKTKLGEQTITVTYDTNKTTTFKVTVKLPEYKFTEGTDQTITIGDNKDLTFKIDGPLELLDKVYINNEELDATNYTTASGSTIITLKKEYVSTLSAGTYTLKATYTNGVSASADFVIKAKETPTTPTTPTTNNSTTNNSTNVNTGDSTNITLWASLLIISGLIGLGYVAMNKKRKYK